MWAFVGIMCQLPLIPLSEKMKTAVHPSLGNFTFWCTMAMGQPALVLLYYRDYILKGNE